MKVANFFDRSLAAAAQVLKGIDPAVFKARLSKLAVALAFDRAAATTSEGVVTLELTTDLLARLYPGLLLIPLDDDDATVALAAKLGKAARSIHAEIDLRIKPAKVCLCLVVGQTAPALSIPTLFMGSCGWTAKFNRDGPLGSRHSLNPFGAAASACIGVANAFRIIFADSLPGSPPDGSVTFDTLYQELRTCPAAPELPERIDLGGTHLIGLGAIGRAAAWTLARALSLRGELHGVDHETIERTNLQRYVGSAQADQTKSRLKTRSVGKMFEGTSVSFVEHPMTWGGYLARRPGLKMETVAVALDTAEGRISVQASLPRQVLNAWTQPGDLGVSRHGFISGPCLACLYLPEGKVPSFSQNVADALHLPEPDIRAKLHAGFKVDRAFIELVSQATGIKAVLLYPFEHRTLSSFYAKAVCGTTYFGSARGGDRGAMAVPMAFQSALAGVLLAVELVAANCDIRTTQIPPETKINLLKPMGTYLTHRALKHRSGYCICQDPSYLDAYRAKYCQAVGDSELRAA